MALTITVTQLPAMYSVRLTATGSTGTVKWYRDTASTSDLYLGSGATLVDRTIPLGEPVTYSATDDLTVQVAAPLTMDTGGLPVLSSTMYSTAYPVTVVSYLPYQGDGASVWHPVIGRSDPFVSIFPATYPAGELVIRAETNTERTNLIRLLQPGDPLLIRSSCGDRLDTFTFMMVGWQDAYTGQDRQGGPHTLTITYQRVTEIGPAWVPPPDWTYQGVLSAHTTYQVVLDTYPTYQALLDRLPG